MIELHTMPEIALALQNARLHGPLKATQLLDRGPASSAVPIRRARSALILHLQLQIWHYGATKA